MISAAGKMENVQVVPVIAKMNARDARRVARYKLLPGKKP